MTKWQIRISPRPPSARLPSTCTTSTKAVAFYRDTLGLRFLFQAGPKMAFFDCGGVRLMLAVPEKPEFDHPGSIFYFKVADIQAVAATLAVPRRAVRGSASPDRRHARS